MRNARFVARTQRLSFRSKSSDSSMDVEILAAIAVDLQSC